MTAADINLETWHLENLHRAILAAWRIEQPPLITSLARMLRDVPLAEDLTQEALVAALEHWPVTGIPEKPGAWLMASAKNRALDHLRRGRMLKRRHDVIAAEMAEEQEAVPDFDSALDDDIGDEMLRLIFTACYPLLAREARAALALRMVRGLTTEEIARAFLQRRRPSGNASCARSARFHNRGSLTKPHAAMSFRCGSPRCWRSSISFSTKAIPPLPARIGCVCSFATKRCGSAACSPPLRHMSPRLSGYWR